MKHHAIEAYGGVEALVRAFVIFALGGSEWLASRGGQFAPRRRTLKRIE